MFSNIDVLHCSLTWFSNIDQYQDPMTRTLKPEDLKGKTLSQAPSTKTLKPKTLSQAPSTKTLKPKTLRPRPKDHNPKTKILLDQCKTKNIRPRP